MPQEGNVSGPTIIQQEPRPPAATCRDPRVGARSHDAGDEDIEEDDAGPRAPYVGRWCDLASADEGDEVHGGDAGEPR